MRESPIEWTNDTLNPWEGCNNVSPGCDHCYAEARDGRFHAGMHWGKEATRLFHNDAYWKQPLRWNEEAARTGIPRRIFCGSLCDVMEDRRDLDRSRERLYRLIEQTLWLDWQLLTKRPQNFRRLLPPAWLEEPPKNVWLLSTVERQDYLWRIETPPFMESVSSLCSDPLTLVAGLGISIGLSLAARAAPARGLAIWPGCGI